MKIIFPELKNQVVQQAIKNHPDIEFIEAADPATAATMLARGEADSMISGLDYSTRDVLIACRDNLPMKSPFFSSCFICQKGDQILALADGGVNKLPDKDQLCTIVEDTTQTFQGYTGKTPRIAMLSYSTKGSGGKNPDLEKIHFVIEKIRANHPDYIIDGEMQLDAAVNPTVATKKSSDLKIQGDANILITPDLNSGNILYKSLEQFGGFHIAGPIIQGFQIPLADLSRGSTADDISFTIDVISKQLKGSK